VWAFVVLGCTTPRCFSIYGVEIVAALRMGIG
jgi:hypothetical protein